jgi:hypothetical protein
MTAITISHKQNPSWLDRSRDKLRQITFPINAYFAVITDIKKRRRILASSADWKGPLKTRLYLIQLNSQTNNPDLKRIVQADIRWLSDTYLMTRPELIGIRSYHVSDIAKTRRAALARHIKLTGNDKPAAEKAILLLARHPGKVTRQDINWLRKVAK